MSGLTSKDAPLTTYTRPVLVDPFASPDSQAVSTPRYPEPCAQLPLKTSTGPTYSDEALATSDLQSAVQAATSHKSASMSSAGTTMSSFDLEKGTSASRDKQDRRSKRDSARDPEKAFYNAQTPARSNRSARHSRRQSREDAGSVVYSDADSEIDAGLALQEAKAMTDEQFQL